MRSGSLPSLAVWLLVALPAGSAVAAEYWVRNGGNDSGDGQSSGTAWATLNHAAAVVGPGDTVRVTDGSYQGFYLTRSGTPGNPITFRAEGSGVSITGDNGTTPDGINLEGASYVVLEGFRVNDRTRAGIRSVINSHVTVRNCSLGHNGRWGVFSGFSDDITIEDNEAYDSQQEHGIYVSNSGDRPVIRRNHVHGNHASGIHMNGDLSQGGDGRITGALVERNVLHDNGLGGGSAINMDGVSDSVVRNNLLFENHAGGISLFRIDGATGSMNNLVLHNTIVQPADGRWAMNINTGSTGNAIRNNILYSSHSFRGVVSIDSSSRSGFSSDFNSVMSRFSTDGGDTVLSLAAWQALGYDLNSYPATPTDLFLAPGSDFHLKEGAPALDAASATAAPTEDIEGNPRPVGIGFDAGAYERQLLSCGNGQPDAGEQCGDPGLSCTDACSTCLNCVCAPTVPVCGDALRCSSEACEADADCAAGFVCESCACVNPPACASGIALSHVRLAMRANEFHLRLSGRVVLPKPWVAVDPLQHGLRLVIDGRTGSGGLDVTLPPGPRVDGVGWKRSPGGRLWTWADPAGSHGGIRRFSLNDRSRMEEGRLTFSARARGGQQELPAVDDVRTAILVGASQECGGLVWQGPEGSRPRCRGDAASLTCR